MGSVRGQPWKWDPDKDDPPKVFKIRWLTDEERSNVTEGRIARFVDSVCDERISCTTDSRKAVKGARRCLQDPQREVTQNSGGPVWRRKLKRTPTARQGEAGGEGERSVGKILKRRFGKEGPETWEQEESAEKKPKTTNKDGVETGPSSSSHYLKRDATEAEMDKPDDEMEITLV